MSDRIYLSKEGVEKLMSDLKELKGPKRRAVIKAIAKARAHGDLRENAEYDVAREEQAHLEKRISEIEGTLARAEILDKSQLSTDKITISKTVKLKDLDSGEVIAYTLVSAEEADPAGGKISIVSPIGKSLIGHKTGDKIDIKIPAGALHYQVTQIDA